MRKIMIIEDDRATREELALLLENEGFQVLAVTDFTDVPGQFQRFDSCDLVLLELGLPDYIRTRRGMGYQVLRS